MIESNRIAKAHSEILELGLASVSTTITESMAELIDSMKEANYKEMMLLTDFYTRDTVADCLPSTGKKHLEFGLVKPLKKSSNSPFR